MKNKSKPDDSAQAQFDAWRDSLPDTHWAKHDLSACKLGWDAALLIMMTTIGNRKQAMTREPIPSKPADSGRVTDEMVEAAIRGWHAHIAALGLGGSAFYERLRAALAAFLAAQGQVASPAGVPDVCETDDEGNPLSPEKLAQWLDAKFIRHGEKEDQSAAACIRRLAAQGQGEAVDKVEAHKSYGAIDRWLRNNMDDEEYTKYSAELDRVFSYRPAPSSPAGVPDAALRLIESAAASYKVPAHLTPSKAEYVKAAARSFIAHLNAQLAAAPSAPEGE